MSRGESTFLFLESWLGRGSFLAAISHLTRQPLGIGLFLLPWTIAYSGLFTGCMIIVFTMVINLARTCVLSSISTKLNDQGIKSPTGYSDWWVLEGCLGGVKSSTATCVLVLFSSLQWLTLLGHASVLFAFAGLNLSQIGGTISTNAYINVRLYVLIAVAVVVLLHPLIQLIRVKLQRPWEDMGCTTICGVGLILSMPSIIFVLLSIPMDIKELSNGDIFVTHWGNVPLSVVIAIFVLGGTPDDVTSAFGVIYRNVNFYAVVAVSGFITLLFAVFFGLTSVIGIQSNICSSITLSLPLASWSQLLRVVASICALLTLLFRYQMDPKLTSRLNKSEMFCDIIFKMLYLCIAGTIAIIIPNMALIAGVFGCTTSVVLTIFFPFTSDIFMRVYGGKIIAGEETPLTSQRSYSMRKEHVNRLAIMADMAAIIIGMLVAGFGIWSIANYATNQIYFAQPESVTCPLNLVKTLAPSSDATKVPV